MSVFDIEVILVLVIILLWLGPFLISLRSGRVHALHPQFITPIWIVYFVLNTMIQVWYPWMGGTEFGILRTTSAEILSNRDYLIIPLLIVALSAPFYHFGVRIFGGSIVKSTHEHTLIAGTSKVFHNHQVRKFAFFAIILSAITWIPNS